MAGDWFPIVIGLHDEPEVIAMAARLETTENEIVGGLCRLWGWANQHTHDGNATGVTFVTLDRYAQRAGFAQAMADVGWLLKTDTGICFPGFDVYNSNSGKTRLMGAKRSKKWRERNASSVTKTSPQYSTEEIKTTPPTPPRGGLGSTKKGGYVPFSKNPEILKRLGPEKPP